MTNHRLDHLLGITGRDPGCDAGLDLFDEYCEAVDRGDTLGARFTDFITHLTNCVACREDAEALLAVLRAQREQREREENSGAR